jgi:hypothetical protein
VVAEPVPVGIVAAAQGKLELLAGSCRQGKILLELEVLAPAVAAAVERHLPPLLTPVPDRREPAVDRVAQRRPEVETNRLTGRAKLKEGRLRKPAVPGGPVLGEGEEGAVLLEELDRVRQLLLELCLELHGIGLHVDQPARPAVLRARDRAAVEVDDELGRVVQLEEPLLAEAVAAAVGVQRLVRPPVAEVEAGEHPVDELGGEERAVLLLALHHHRGGPGMGLDVVGIEAEATQAEQVVQRLPDHARDRDLGHHSEDGDAAPAAHRRSPLGLIRVIVSPLWRPRWHCPRAPPESSAGARRWSPPDDADPPRAARVPR